MTTTMIYNCTVCCMIKHLQSTGRRSNSQDIFFIHAGCFRDMKSSENFPQLLSHKYFSFGGRGPAMRVPLYSSCYEYDSREYSDNHRIRTLK